MVQVGTKGPWMVGLLCTSLGSGEPPKVLEQERDQVCFEKVLWKLCLAGWGVALVHSYKGCGSRMEGD